MRSALAATGVVLVFLVVLGFAGRARAQQADPAEAIPGSATTRRCTSRPAPRWRWSGTRARRSRPSTGPPASASAASFALGLGIAKEVWDLSGHGDASWRDLTWDVVGTTTGVLVAYAVDWAIGRLRGPSTGGVRSPVTDP